MTKKKLLSLLLALTMLLGMLPAAGASDSKIVAYYISSDADSYFYSYGLQDGDVELLTREDATAKGADFTGMDNYALRWRVEAYDGELNNAQLFTPGESVDLSLYTDETGVKITAVFGYEVTIDPNNDVDAPYVEFVEEGSTFTLPELEDTQDGKYLQYWQSENGDTYSPNYVAYISENSSFTAVWSDYLTVTFKAAPGGEAKNSFNELKFLDNIVLPGIDSTGTESLDSVKKLLGLEDGQEISGWYVLNPENDHENFDLDGVYADPLGYSYTVTESVVIVPALSTETVTLTIDSGVVNQGTKTLSLAKGASLVLRDPINYGFAAPEADTYAFKAWDYNSTEYGLYYYPITVETDSTVTALWTPYVTVRYVANSSFTYDEAFTLEMEFSQVAGEDRLPNSEVPLPTEVSGYKWIGFTSSDDGKVYPPEYLYTFTQDVTFTTAFVEDANTVVFHFDPGNEDYQLAIPAAEVNWDKAQPYPIAEALLYDKPDNVVFTGWEVYTDAEFATRFDEKLYQSGEDFTPVEGTAEYYFKATWVNTYNVSFYGADGVPSLVCKEGDVIQIPDFTSEDSNRVFAGWSLEGDESGKIYKAGEEYTVNQSASFYAEYIDIYPIIINMTVHGNADEAQHFTANVTLSDSSGSALTGDFSVYNGKEDITVTADENGSFSFDIPVISGGNTYNASIKGIAVGTNYKISIDYPEEGYDSELNDYSVEGTTENGYLNLSCDAYYETFYSISFDLGEMKDSSEITGDGLTGYEASSNYFVSLPDMQALKEALCPDQTLPEGMDNSSHYFEIDGKVIKGWYLNGDASYLYPLSAQFMPTADSVFTAVWDDADKVTYTLTINPGYYTNANGEKVWITAEGMNDSAYDEITYTGVPGEYVDVGTDESCTVVTTLDTVFPTPYEFKVRAWNYDVYDANGNIVASGGMDIPSLHLNGNTVLYPEYDEVIKLVLDYGDSETVTIEHTNNSLLTGLDERGYEGERYGTGMESGYIHTGWYIDNAPNNDSYDAGEEVLWSYVAAGTNSNPWVGLSNLEGTDNGCTITAMWAPGYEISYVDSIDEKSFSYSYKYLDEDEAAHTVQDASKVFLYLDGWNRDGYILTNYIQSIVGDTTGESTEVSPGDTISNDAKNSIQLTAQWETAPYTLKIIDSYDNSEYTGTQGNSISIYKDAEGSYVEHSFSTDIASGDWPNNSDGQLCSPYWQWVPMVDGAVVEGAEAMSSSDMALSASNVVAYNEQYGQSYSQFRLYLYLQEVDETIYKTGAVAIDLEFNDYEEPVNEFKLGIIDDLTNSTYTGIEYGANTLDVYSGETVTLTAECVEGYVPDKDDSDEEFTPYSYKWTIMPLVEGNEVPDSSGEGVVSAEKTGDSITRDDITGAFTETYTSYRVLLYLFDPDDPENSSGINHTNYWAHVDVTFNEGERPAEVENVTLRIFADSGLGGGLGDGGDNNENWYIVGSDNTTFYTPYSNESFYAGYDTASSGTAIQAGYEPRWSLSPVDESGDPMTDEDGNAIGEFWTHIYEDNYWSTSNSLSYSDVKAAAQNAGYEHVRLTLAMQSIDTGDIFDPDNTKSYMASVLLNTPAEAPTYEVELQAIVNGENVGFDETFKYNADVYFKVVVNNAPEGAVYTYIWDVWTDGYDNGNNYPEDDEQHKNFWLNADDYCVSEKNSVSLQNDLRFMKEDAEYWNIYVQVLDGNGDSVGSDGKDNITIDPYDYTASITANTNLEAVLDTDADVTFSAALDPDSYTGEYTWSWAAVNTDGDIQCSFDGNDRLIADTISLKEITAQYLNVSNWVISAYAVDKDSGKRISLEATQEITVSYTGDFFTMIEGGYKWWRGTDNYFLTRGGNHGYTAYGYGTVPDGYQPYFTIQPLNENGEPLVSYEYVCGASYWDDRETWGGKAYVYVSGDEMDCAVAYTDEGTKALADSGYSEHKYWKLTLKAAKFTTDPEGQTPQQPTEVYDPTNETGYMSAISIDLNDPLGLWISDADSNYSLEGNAELSIYDGIYQNKRGEDVEGYSAPYWSVVPVENGSPVSSVSPISVKPDNSSWDDDYDWETDESILRGCISGDAIYSAVESVDAELLKYNTWQITLQIVNEEGSAYTGSDCSPTVTVSFTDWPEPVDPYSILVTDMDTEVVYEKDGTVVKSVEDERSVRLEAALYENGEAYADNVAYRWTVMPDGSDSANTQQFTGSTPDFGTIFNENSDTDKWVLDISAYEDTNADGAVTEGEALLSSCINYVLFTGDVAIISPSDEQYVIFSVGDEVTLSVKAVNAESYQWQYRQWEYDFANIDGAASDTLTITNIGYEQYGDYRCLVTGTKDNVETTLPENTEDGYPVWHYSVRVVPVAINTPETVEIENGQAVLDVEVLPEMEGYSYIWYVIEGDEYKPLVEDGSVEDSSYTVADAVADSVYKVDVFYNHRLVGSSNDVTLVDDEPDPVELGTVQIRATNTTSNSVDMYSNSGDTELFTVEANPGDVYNFELYYTDASGQTVTPTSFTSGIRHYVDSVETEASYSENLTTYSGVTMPEKDGNKPVSLMVDYMVQIDEENSLRLTVKYVITAEYELTMVRMESNFLATPLTFQGQTNVPTDTTDKLVVELMQGNETVTDDHDITYVWTVGEDEAAIDSSIASGNELKLAELMKLEGDSFYIVVEAHDKSLTNEDGYRIFYFYQTIVRDDSQGGGETDPTPEESGLKFYVNGTEYSNGETVTVAPGEVSVSAVGYGLAESYAISYQLDGADASGYLAEGVLKLSFDAEGSHTISATASNAGGIALLSMYDETTGNYNGSITLNVSAASTPGSGSVDVDPSDENDANNPTSIDVTGILMDDVTVVNEPVYSVEIVWGDMAFVYHKTSSQPDKVWNPTLHEWEQTGTDTTTSAVWELNTAGALELGDGSAIFPNTDQSHAVVFNHSNAPVNVKMTITSAQTASNVVIGLDSVSGGVTGTAHTTGTGLDYALPAGVVDTVYASTTGAAAKVSLSNEPTGLSEEQFTTLARLDIVISKPSA